MQFGLWLQLYPGEDVAATLARVAALGFADIHAHFPQGCDEALARATAAGATAAGLEIAAVSGYANPLRPHEAPMGATLQQLDDLARLMPIMGARRLVSWGGTYGAGLLDDHADNQTDQAWATLQRSVEDLLPLLDAVDATLVLEPFFSHILATQGHMRRLAKLLGWSPRLRFVFDPPNLLPPGTWDEHGGKMLVMATALAPLVGLVHLKDMRMDAARLELPGPGAGVLDYAAFRRAIADSGIVASLIVEHVTLDQAEAALRFVQRVWSEG